MTFEEYQKKSRQTAIYPEVIKNAPIILYPTLGLVGEAGEVAEKMKKILRDKNGVISAEDREDFKKELGDILWYIAQFASELEIDLEEIAQANLDKLLSRKKRGVIHGSGDDR